MSATQSMIRFQFLHPSISHEKWQLLNLFKISLCPLVLNNRNNPIKKNCKSKNQNSRYSINVMAVKRDQMNGKVYTSRKAARSILPSSVKNAWNKILSLKYHTGCWLFFKATCKTELGGPWDMFWNITIGRSVLADVPGCNCGT